MLKGYRFGVYGLTLSIPASLKLFLGSWTAYATVVMKDRESMEKMTPVGGLCQGREIFEQIVEDFQLEQQESDIDENI